jgi:hypothetical protein
VNATKAASKQFGPILTVALLVLAICVGLVHSISKVAFAFGPKIHLGGARGYGDESSALLACLLVFVGFWIFSQVCSGTTWERFYSAGFGLFGLVTSSDALRFTAELAWARDFWRIERIPREPARVALIALVAIPALAYLTLLISSLGAILFAVVPQRWRKRNLPRVATIGRSSRAWILRASLVAIWLQLASHLVPASLLSSADLTFPTVGGISSGGEIQVLFHQWWLHLELLGALKYLLGAWAAITLAKQVNRVHRWGVVRSMASLSIPKESTLDVVSRLTDRLVVVGLPLAYVGLRPRLPDPLFKQFNVKPSQFSGMQARMFNILLTIFSPLRGPNNWLVLLLPLSLAVVAGFGMVSLVEYTRSTGTRFNRFFQWVSRKGFGFRSSAQLAVVLLPLFALALPVTSNSYRLFMKAPASLLTFISERNQQVQYYAPTNRFPFSISDPDTVAAAMSVFFVYVGMAVGRYRKSLIHGIFVITFGFFAFVADVPALVGGFGIGAAIATSFERKRQTDDLSYQAASLPILAITVLSVGWALTPDIDPPILVAVALLGALTEIWDRDFSSWTQATVGEIFALPLILLGLCVAEAASPKLLSTNGYGILGEQFARPYIALPLVTALAIQRTRVSKTTVCSDRQALTSDLSDPTVALLKEKD